MSKYNRHSMAQVYAWAKKTIALVDHEEGNPDHIFFDRVIGEGRLVIPIGREMELVRLALYVSTVPVLDWEEFNNLAYLPGEGKAICWDFSFCYHSSFRPKLKYMRDYLAKHCEDALFKNPSKYTQAELGQVRKLWKLLCYGKPAHMPRLPKA